MTVTHIHDEDGFQTALQKAGQKLVVVDFTAKWCGPCKQIAPFFEDLGKKYKHVVFLKVDVDECQDIAASNDVKAMPTFVFFKSKTEVTRIRGADASGLESKVRELAGTASTFEGEGMRLGSNNNTATTDESGASGFGGLLASLLGGGGPSDVKNAENNNSQNEEAAVLVLNVDNAMPITSVQIRLADGTKLTIKINLSQPVSKIREYICTARPGYAARPFTLMTTFPSKELSDEELTIECAKLANSVVVQKLK